MKRVLYLLIAALLLGLGSANAAPQKKHGGARQKKAPAAHTAVTPANFSGSFTNSYSDGVGGMTTHLLTINFDEASGTATGIHTNESGEERAFHGKLQGNKLVCTYDDDGDEFATMTLIDANTIKLAGFTGTFKRGTATTVTPAYNGESGAAYVDPGYEQVKQHLQQQKELQQQQQQQQQQPETK